MKDLKIFENQEFGKVRTIIIDNEPWFVGKDVAEILGYTNPSKALADRVDEEDKLNNETLSSLGQRGGWLINESGLYSLILSSKLPNAKKFKKWVTSEVLPSIRKHGMYATDELINNPDLLIKVATALKEEKERNKVLQLENSTLKVDNTIMKPKAEYFDELVDRNLLTSFRETAKELKIKEKEFIAFLLSKRYIYRDRNGKLKPYASKNKGLFEVKECYSDKTSWKGTQTLITPKGRETFRLLFRGFLLEREDIL